MNIGKQALDRYLTTEPDNGYHSWLERVWDLIPEIAISGDEYDKHELFFSYWENDLARIGKNGFLSAQFAADAIKLRYRQFMFLLETGWEMKTADCFTNSLHEEDNKIGYNKQGMTISAAYEYEWYLVERKKS